MTQKLYDSDSYITSFTANVISCTACDNGFAAVLDKTAFFPEEGGQKSDTGTLDNANVFDVQLVQGEIVHYLDKPVKGIVKGEINWDKRFRNMQQHTGEHIISGIVYKKYGFNNVGFHLGADDVTMDIDGILNLEQLLEIEAEANQAVAKNVKVTAYYPSPDELSGMFYRSKLDITENVRVVIIDGYDACACCAPHVKNTGEIGMIKILDFAKHKKGIRLHIKCGFDALADYNIKYSNVKEISALLAAPQHTTAIAVKELIAQNKNLSYQLSLLRKELAVLKVSLLEYTPNNLCLFEEAADMNDLRNIVNAAKEKCGGVCAAISKSQSGYTYVMYSKSNDIKEKAALIHSVLGGKGGGKNNMLQGSFTANKEQIESFILSL